MGGCSGCETTVSTGLSPLPNSLLSHCSHGGNSFTAETFVNDDRESGRRLRLWPERPSLTKVSAVKHAPPCETMDHTRPFQLVLVSRWRGPRLLLENRPGRMLLKLLSPILHLLPVGGPLNEIVNLHNCEVRRMNTFARPRNDGRVHPTHTPYPGSGSRPPGSEIQMTVCASAEWRDRWPLPCVSSTNAKLPA